MGYHFIILTLFTPTNIPRLLLYWPCILDEAILCFRLYALYNCSRRLKYSIALLYIVITGSALGLLIPELLPLVRELLLIYVRDVDFRHVKTVRHPTLSFHRSTFLIFLLSLTRSVCISGSIAAIPELQLCGITAVPPSFYRFWIPGVSNKIHAIANYPSIA